MKTTLPDLDLDAIAARIGLARQVFGSDFNLGSVDFTSGELTPRSTVDILRDQDRVQLFREVRRLRLVKDPVVLHGLLQEAYDLLTNPDTRLDLRDWKRAAAPFVSTTTADDQDPRIDSTGDPQDSRPASKGGGV